MKWLGNTYYAFFVILHTGGFAKIVFPATQQMLNENDLCQVCKNNLVRIIAGVKTLDKQII